MRSEGRGALLWSLRITSAATASYVVGTLIFPGTQPLLAPLTAMLVVQVTPVSLLASGLDRVIAVVTGVSLAVGFASVVPLEWWSLAILIFVSLLIGQALRLQSNLIEVAISGMLVLGVGVLSAESAAWQRIAETLVGAAVGIAANLLVPPRIPTADAGRAIEGLADAVSDLLSRSADALEQLATEHQPVGAAAAAWLGDARRITHHDVPRVGATVLHAEQGRRLNVRAVGTADLGPGLRHGLEALEHTAVTVRSMYRALADATSGGAAWTAEDTAEDVVLGLVQTFRELAAAVDAFGELVRLEAAPARKMGSADFGALRAAMDGLPEARSRLEELVMAETDPDLRELHASVLSSVKRVQQELDLEHRVRRQLQLRRPVRTRPAPLRPHAARRRQPSPFAEAEPDAETQLMPKLDDDIEDQ
ncbi:FUSC family protein [Nocardioides panaciterrulae]|uniref:Integral membrane bound transporter domain-containing protein n=1 Tax=Nocardioides panaciterrulae TaxID=661492 RepID=A0A7Y9JCV9_9ACTN|nr:hypothetical protein [Nocardioides panaciterrulae]